MSREKNWQNKKRNLQNPKERNLRMWRGNALDKTLYYFLGEEIPKEPEYSHTIEKEKISVFQGFLQELREGGIRVSTPEWMHFLAVIKGRFNFSELSRLAKNQQLFETLRIYAKVTLIKDRSDEAMFNEIFNRYFLSIAKVVEEKIIEIDIVDLEEQRIEQELEELFQEAEKLSQESVEQNEEIDSETPEMKEQLGIDEVDENLETPEDGARESEEEKVHGGQKDQHNDILKKADENKVGGGNKKENQDGGEGNKGQPSEGQGKEGSTGTGQGDKGQAGKGEGDLGDAGKGKGDKGELSGMGKKSGDEHIEGAPDSQNQNKIGQDEAKKLTEQGNLIGGGKGKSLRAARIAIMGIEPLSRERSKKQYDEMRRHDSRSRYDKRPEKKDITRIIRSLRKIIQDVSQVKTGKVDVKNTVRRFARRDLRIEYRREREKQPEIVLFIDVGGPVDEWSPLIKEVAEEMTKGLTKLEVYLFHNNLYGYVWKPDKKDFLSSSYAKPNSLIDVKSIVKRKKKVIIYGDAEMSYSEFEDDQWEPRDNEERIKKMSMGGDRCLEWIKKKAGATVWINPAFKNEWEDRDDSGTISAAQEIIPMYDLSIGGVEDAIKELMKRR